MSYKKNFIVMMSLSSLFMTAPSFAIELEAVVIPVRKQIKKPAKKSAKKVIVAEEIKFEPAPQPQIQAQPQAPVEKKEPINVNVMVVNNPPAQSPSSVVLQDVQDLHLTKPKLLNEIEEEKIFEINSAAAEVVIPEVPELKLKESELLVSKSEENEEFKLVKPEILADLDTQDYQLTKPKLLEEEEKDDEEEVEEDDSSYISKVLHLPTTEIVGDPNACPDSHNDALTEKLEKLIADQNKVIMDLAKTMTAFMAQQQSLPLRGSGETHYEYTNPNSSGAWVYLPGNGQAPSYWPNQAQAPQVQVQQTQPQQQAAPQVQPAPQAPVGYNGWELSPEYRFTPTQRENVVPGNFSMATPGSFNFGS